jgi:hypothetical protein
LASYVFYGWWDIRFLFLIILTTLIDFSCGLIISDGIISRKQRLEISISLIGASLLFIFLPTFVLNNFLFYLRHFHNEVLPKKTMHINLADCFHRNPAGELLI